MAKYSVVFLGAKPVGFHCFQYLLSQREALNLECRGLFYHHRGNHPAPPWEETARAHGVPVFRDLDQIPEADMLYSVQYHQILGAEHLKRVGLPLNLHMAPLPEYRGSNAFSMAIIEGKKEFGTTVHIMEEKTDQGDILFQKRFPIPDSCWVGELYEITLQASCRLFEQTLGPLVRGQFRRLPQKDLVPSLGSSFHFRKEIQQWKRIDLSWDAEKIERHIRATSMPGFPPPYAMVAGKKISFHIDPES